MEIIFFEKIKNAKRFFVFTFILLTTTLVMLAVSVTSETVNVENVQVEEQKFQNLQVLGQPEGLTVELDDIIRRASVEYGVDTPLIKAVIMSESRFDPNAVSHVGASGLMQLMPATASYLGVQDPFDPEENIFAGTRYFSGFMQKYDGNIELALAAYNAGPTRVSEYGGVPPFPQTQSYINKVMGYYIEFQEI
ncbi:MAG: lytic transglycosylase domain-containing protein [Patescibacteria group bacterium]